MAALAAAVQAGTGTAVAVGFVDQGSTGEAPAPAAAGHGIQLAVVKLPVAKRGFVLLPRRWVVERSCAWVARFRRLARDYERLPETVVGLHFLAFACLLLHRLIPLLAESPEQALAIVAVIDSWARRPVHLGIEQPDHGNDRCR